MVSIAMSSSSTDSNLWLVDSGCTNHMTKDHQFFSFLDTSIHTKVKLGNGDLVYAKGKGTVVLHTDQGKKVISDVLYVPQLDQNLLSVAQLIKKGYSVLFQNNFCQILDLNGLLVLSIPMINNSFSIQWNSTSVCVSVSTLNNTWLWHKRYGHINLKSLQFAYKHNFITGLSSIAYTNDVCRTCQLGKSHRKPFHVNQAWRASEKLELVHSDVCGPMNTASLSNNKYFVLFIDDYTRMTWVYFMSCKS